MTNTNENRHFVQVAMPDWMFNAFSDLAADLRTEKRTLLESFIDKYLEDKQAYEQEENRHLILYASPVNGKARSMWISPNHYQKIDAFSKLHDTRLNRVIFSACIQGLVDQHRIKI